MVHKAMSFVPDLSRVATRAQRLEAGNLGIRVPQQIGKAGLQELIDAKKAELSRSFIAKHPNFAQPGTVLAWKRQRYTVASFNPQNGRVTLAAEGRAATCYAYELAEAREVR